MLFEYISKKSNQSITKSQELTTCITTTRRQKKTRTPNHNKTNVKPQLTIFWIMLNVRGSTYQLNVTVVIDKNSLS